MKPRIAITLGPDDIQNGNTKQTYRDAVSNAGGEPILVTPEDGKSAADLLGSFDGLLLTGGTDLDPEAYGGRPHPAVERAHPARDGLELDAARYAKRSGLPTLAICRGMQVVNVALGGTLYEDIPDQYEPPNGLRLRHYQTPDFSRKETTHPVDIERGSALAGIAETSSLATNSMHHQGVKRVAYGLQPVAHARDGIVEALELQGEHPFFIAVQWHPEELVDTDAPSRRLFSRFVAAARKRAEGRGAKAPTS